jgi:Domain of unknown function (DUF4173)
MTRPVALRILAIAAAIGLISQAVLFGTLLGVNVTLLTVAVLGAAFAVRPRERRIDPADAWLPVAAVALAVAIAIRADPTLLLLDVLAFVTLVGASVAAIGGEAVTRRSAIRVGELGLVVLGWSGIGILRASAALRRPANPDRPPRRLPPWAVPVARGLVLAIPVLVVFAGLFAAADLMFEELLARLFAWDVDLGLVPLRLAIAFLVAWVVAGLLSVAAGAVHADSGPEPEGASPALQSLGAAAAGLPGSSAGAAGAAASPWLPFRLGTIEASTILVAVDVLFASFVLVQLRYLFGGHDDLAVSGLPYSTFARSGFFELVWVAFLAGGLLASIHAVVDRRTAVLVGAGIVLAALTGAILVSALIRLRIYQEAYGWAELRFYVLATIVWLGIGIGITIALLARDRMGWLLHGLAIAAVVVLVGTNVVGPSRLIAEENVARVLDPTLVPRDGKTGLDVYYATALGDDAVPALVRALPALAPPEQSDLWRWLDERRRALAEPDATAWPAWNLGRQQARDALAGLLDR